MARALGDGVDVDRLRARLVPHRPALVPELTILRAAPGSRLRDLAGARTPYWAYVWPGGALLARHLLDRPDLSAGRRVVDIGTGGGIAAIAAARTGATVLAVDLDPSACAVARLNAELNGVFVDIRCRDGFALEVGSGDLVLVGDVFYAAPVARRAAAFLERVAEAGADILVGDIGRRHLPHRRLEAVATYDLADVGTAETSAGAVYRWIGTGRPGG